MKNGLVWLGLAAAVVAVNLYLSTLQPFSEARFIGLPVHLGLAGIAAMFGLLMFVSHRIYTASAGQLRQLGLTDEEIEAVSRARNSEAKLLELLERKKVNNA
ncbi:MAG: hypothetical protein R3265_08950 [Hyphomonas sp.]|nr:hypothetical protein [Hyphomonas sp.]